MARASTASSRHAHQAATQSLVWSLQRATESTEAACAGIRALSEMTIPDERRLTYDQVIVSLATLQSAVSDLSRAYINHANTVLNRSPVNLDTGLTSNLTTTLFENGLLGAGPRHISPPAKEAPGEKKKRKRAPHDPNAPKRALTPYFLYMQHNRSQIAQELGTNAKPKDVADEGTKRWAEMADGQKEV